MRQLVDLPRVLIEPHAVLSNPLRLLVPQVGEILLDRIEVLLGHGRHRIHVAGAGLSRFVGGDGRRDRCVEQAQHLPQAGPGEIAGERDLIALHGLLPFLKIVDHRAVFRQGVEQELFGDPVEGLRIAAKIDFDTAVRLLAERDPQHDTFQTDQHRSQLFRVDFLVAAKRHTRDTFLDIIQIEHIFQVQRQDQFGAGLLGVADGFLNVIAELRRGLVRGRKPTCHGLSAARGQDRQRERITTPRHNPPSAATRRHARQSCPACRRVSWRRPPYRACS